MKNYKIITLNIFMLLLLSLSENILCPQSSLAFTQQENKYTYTLTIETIKQLKFGNYQLSARSVQVLGYYSPGDGGGGPIRFWSETSSCEDDGGACIDPVPVNGKPGRWLFNHSGPVNIKWFGAVGDFDFSTLAGTDSRNAIQNALYSAVQKDGTGAVFAPSGQYLINTAPGSIIIPEGVEFYGLGGAQTRRPIKSSHGTKFCIRGEFNAAFVYERGVYVHNISIDYPDQTKGAGPPINYPACFDRGDSTGSRSIFKNIIFDRCYFAFDSGGGTIWENIHGVFYRYFIRITSSKAFCHITNCSSTNMWNMGPLNDGMKYQQDNLVWLEIAGGADGVLIGNCTVFLAAKLLNFTGGASVNFLRVNNVLADGVMSPLAMDGTVKVLSVQFSNCMFRLKNEFGNISLSSSMVINSAETKYYSDRIIQFNNCRFRVIPGGMIRITGGGIDKFILNDCSVYSWNEEGKNYNEPLIKVEYEKVNLQISGGMYDNFKFEKISNNSTIVEFKSNSLMSFLIIGTTIQNVQKVVRYDKNIVINKALYLGNSGSNITTPVDKGVGAIVESEVNVANIW